jgi:hypothetical protein
MNGIFVAERIESVPDRLQRLPILTGERGTAGAQIGATQPRKPSSPNSPSSLASPHSLSTTNTHSKNAHPPTQPPSPRAPHHLTSTFRSQFRRLSVASLALSFACISLSPNKMSDIDPPGQALPEDQSRRTRGKIDMHQPHFVAGAIRRAALDHIRSYREVFVKPCAHRECIVAPPWLRAAMQ